ncbi:MAG: hypothetical protein AAB955_01960 [Patescibacteria group bacterium]
MYAVRVIPIVRGPLKGELTFFSRDSVPEGAIVSVPLRKKMVPGLVVSARDVREEKQVLKAADFALRKIGRAAPRRILSPAFMRAVSRTARYFVAPEGAVLSALTFQHVLTSIRIPECSPPSPKAMEGAARPEVLLLQADTDERLSEYRNLAREAFARQNSIMIIASSLIEVEALAAALGRGIEDQVVTLSGDMGDTKVRAAWTKAVSPGLPAQAGVPLLIIGTPPALSAPVPNLETIIVERESARSYKGRVHPYLDHRLVAEWVAAESGARFILADFPVRVETRARIDAIRAEWLTRPAARPRGRAIVTLFDTRVTEEKKKERRAFQPISVESVTAIEEELARGGRVAVFAARRGIAPLTVCNDCGTPVQDRAGTPMTLHKTPEGPAFISHKTGALMPANIRCTTCTSWNLVSLGIGVDRVHEELKKRLPKASPILFSADTARTHAEAKRLQRALYDKPGTIIVGTERMLPYLTEGVELAVVASIDSMLSLSAWRAHEHALQTLMYLRTRATERLIIESRKPESEVLRVAVSGDIQEFYEREAAERKEYEYPPFATFIGLTWVGTEVQNKLVRDSIIPALKNYDVVGPLPPEVVERNRMRERAVIRIPVGQWPNDDLLAILDTLPPSVSITVDPDDIV